jgi:hypothetical protein
MTDIGEMANLFDRRPCLPTPSAAGTLSLPFHFETVPDHLRLALSGEATVAYLSGYSAQLTLASAAAWSQEKGENSPNLALWEGGHCCRAHAREGRRQNGNHQRRW